MGFLDIIKKGVVEQFTGTLSAGDIFLSLLIAFLSAMIVTSVSPYTPPIVILPSGVWTNILPVFLLFPSHLQLYTTLSLFHISSVRRKNEFILLHRNDSTDKSSASSSFICLCLCLLNKASLMSFYSIFQWH